MTDTPCTIHILPDPAVHVQTVVVEVPTAAAIEATRDHVVSCIRAAYAGALDDAVPEIGQPSIEADDLLRQRNDLIMEVRRAFSMLGAGR